MIKKYKKKDGSQAWKIVAYLGVDPATGRQRRTTRQGFATKREAQAALRALELKGLPEKKKPKITLQQLFDEWFALYQPTVKPSTSYKLKVLFTHCALNKVGKCYIDKLTPHHLQKLMDTKFIAQSRQTAATLRRLFRYAVKVGYLNSNPADGITPPRQSSSMTTKQVKFLTLPQINRLFDNIKNYPHPIAVARDTAVVLLLIYSGLRIGEALALEWNDINGNLVQVYKTVAYAGNKPYISSSPKTATSRRTIQVNDLTIERLQNWRKVQINLAKKMGKPAPSFVITSLKTCDFVSASNFAHVLPRYLDGLPKITWHALRHTHASLLFASGASMKDVQERLGHSNIETTMNVYTHILPKRKTQVITNFFKYMDKNT